MNTVSKLTATIIACLLPTIQICSQDKEDNKVEAYIDATIVSHYMWRGTDMGGVSIQPTAYVSWKGLILKAEGNAGLESIDNKELDLLLGYERYGFNIGITDYWVSGADKNNRYFHYEEHGAHQFEANIGYTCKYGSLQAYTMFWGNDFKISGKRAYSTYAQLDVPFKLGGLDWNLAVGGTFFESAGHVTESPGIYDDEIIYISNYYYAKGPACVMAALRATKTLELNSVHLPVFVEMHTNPYMQTANLLFGVTINPF